MIIFIHYIPSGHQTLTFSPARAGGALALVPSANKRAHARAWVSQLVAMGTGARDNSASQCMLSLLVDQRDNGIMMKGLCGSLSLSLSAL